MPQNTTYCVFILKVHTGLHCTAEFLLENQEYTIGSDHNSDIILQDPCICAHHAKLQLLENKVYLQPIKGAKINVNGLPITQVFNINPLDILEIGNIVISLYSFKLSSNSKLAQQFLTAADSKKALDQLESLKESIRFKEEVQSKIADCTNQGCSYYFLIATVGIIILSLVLNFSSWSSQELADSQTNIPHSTTENNVSFEMALNNYLQQSSSEISVSVDHDNRIIILQGYVQSQKDKYVLLKPIPHINYQKIVKVNIIDNMVDTMQNIAHIAGVSNINISYNGTGNFTLKGIVNSSKDIEIISYLINLDVQGIKNLNVELIPVKQLDDCIQGVSISGITEKSYIKTTDNKKKYVGSYLLPNVIISKIEDYVVELQYYDKTIKYDFVHNKFLEIK